jgi:hypothetical protein
MASVFVSIMMDRDNIIVIVCLLFSYFAVIVIAYLQQPRGNKLTIYIDGIFYMNLTNIYLSSTI